MEFAVGEIIELKKPHPCGSYTWKILRVGADFRLSCTGCGRQIMLPRRTVEKSLCKRTGSRQQDQHRPET